ncbi:hypothetical protein AB1Y20_012863 [Prymnesium parvum]|uniref:Uncharacterized protein n=1 Tax=Prymnesium parvum TaxID=97485 RepID=A0AB34IJ27_PRYPA
MPRALVHWRQRSICLVCGDGSTRVAMGFLRATASAGLAVNKLFRKRRRRGSAPRDGGGVAVASRSAASRTQECSRYIPARIIQLLPQHHARVRFLAPPAPPGSHGLCSLFTCLACITVSPFQCTRSLTSASLLFIILSCPSVNAIFDFEAYMKASNAGASDFFGYSVSLSGDTLAVGSRLEDSCATTVSTSAATDDICTNAGAVFVFTRSSTTWTLEAYMKAPNAGDSDFFGEFLALSGDTLAVAAPQESSCNTTVSTTAATDNECSNAGAVYVFTRSGTTWTFEAYVKAPNSGTNDYFGMSLSLSGETLAVGSFQEDSCQTTISTSAPTDDDGCADAGAVYVFTRSGTTWTFEAFVKASNAEANDYFGCSISLSGDTLAVGSYQEDSCQNTISTSAATTDACADAGAVYVFTRSGTTAVSLSGDTLIAASPQEDSCGTTVSTSAATDDGCLAAGAAYVFTRSGTTWTLEAYVKAPNSEENDWYGWTASVSGDKLAVGTRLEDSCGTGVATTAATGNGCSNSGAVYVYSRSGSTWTFEAYVKAPNVAADNYFGNSISLSGDTLAAGAYGEDSCGTSVSTTAATNSGCDNTGAAYGEHNGIYVLLSTPTLSISARFEHSTFFTPYSKLKVRGSWIKQVFWTVRTRHGQLLHADLSATSPSFNGSRARHTKTVDDVTFHFDGRALAVSTPKWFTRAVVQKGKPHPGHLRVAVTVRPLYNVKQGKVAPHGLLGQTYDDDNAPLHGKRDSYAVLDDGTRTEARREAGGVVTTRARGEGAIEGHAEMYRVQQPYDTQFAFTRFGRTTNFPARNVSLLRSFPSR